MPNPIGTRSRTPAGDRAGRKAIRRNFLRREALWRRLTGMSAQHKKYFDTLTPEERMLVVLRDELYSGSWDRMLQDLRDRLRGRPYIFKLVNRIQEDIARIEKLQEYEKKHGVNLGDFIKGGKP